MEKHNRIAFGDKKLPLPSSFAWITIVLLINSINHGIFCAVTLNGSNSGNAIASSSSSESIFASVMTSSPSSTKSAAINTNENRSPMSSSIALSTGQSENLATASMTVSDIESPLSVSTVVHHEYLGTMVPNKRERDGILRALDWLTQKRSSDYGWSNDTHMVILAKELSGARDFADSVDIHLQIIQDLESELSVKQMTIDILSLIDHHHHSIPTKVLNVQTLARYILALGALCKDPKHFMNQHNLIALLQRYDTNDDHTFALSTLAVCSMGERVRKRQIRKLIDIASESNVQDIETMSMVILALRCVLTDHHHRQLSHFVRRLALRLAVLQNFEGNFGSLKSTALAMQALQDLHEVSSTAWNRGLASKWILDHQREDGGWTEEPLTDGQDPTIGIGLTANIILALSGKGLGTIRLLECNNVLRDTSIHRYETTEQKLASPVVITPVGPIEQRVVTETVSYTFTIWFATEPKPTDAIKLAMISPRNTTFFQAMVQAADIDPRFSFEAREWPNGHYIHTIGDRQEDPTTFSYWLLYRLTNEPDPLKPPSNEFIKSMGVDEIIVENDTHYLYWFKKL